MLWLNQAPAGSIAAIAFSRVVLEDAARRLPEMASMFIGFMLSY
jgi:hypothetical protein